MIITKQIKGSTIHPIYNLITINTRVYILNSNSLDFKKWQYNFIVYFK